MSNQRDDILVEAPALRERRSVFESRRDAGERLAELVRDAGEADGALLAAIPSGGIPVAVRMAELLDLPLEPLVVSKVTPRFNTEIGYGAVAFDGTMQLNEPLARRLRLSAAEVAADLARTQAKVAHRMELLRGQRLPPDLAGRRVVVVDDGLASGVTMLVAVAACRKAGAAGVAVAVPTAHDESARRLAAEADRVIVANLRSGEVYAVADAYRQWHDVSDAEVAACLARLARRGGAAM
jgi:predicted phosphoribosyltransferase